MYKKIAVAMSGGVDSSVAAYLLKKQGHDIFGVFMHLWADPEFSEAENKCCSLESREDARIVANKLNIPFYTINLSKEFKRRIVNDFINQYRIGATPNPCILCNKYIKFDLLLNKVIKMGATHLATGHYTKLINNKVFKSKDKVKDQTYFLCQINLKILPSLMFPLGNYTKNQIWQIAKNNELIPEKKKESQDVCFVPKGKLNLFLHKYINKQKYNGRIIDINNNSILEKQADLYKYTIGQKAGIGGKGPYYVIKKDIKKGIIFITNNKTDNHLYKKKITVKKINWLCGQKIKFPLKCLAKCRYSQAEAQVMVNHQSVYFKKPQKIVTPGQSIVFYKNNQLLGGGIIK